MNLEQKIVEETEDTEMVEIDGDDLIKMLIDEYTIFERLYLDTET